jgi:hypothetical protein
MAHLAVRGSGARKSSPAWEHPVRYTASQSLSRSSNGGPAGCRNCSPVCPIIIIRLTLRAATSPCFSHGAAGAGRRQARPLGRGYSLSLAAPILMSSPRVLTPMAPSIGASAAEWASLGVGRATPTSRRKTRGWGQFSTTATMSVLRAGGGGPAAVNSLLTVPGAKRLR